MFPSGEGLADPLDSFCGIYFGGFGCQKVVHNLADVKLHKAGIRFVTLGEN